MVTIFFSYSHADEKLRDELDKHLSALKRQGLISGWHDRRILAGGNLNKAIDENIDNAEIILFLLSADFINSNYCYDVEVTRAMKRHALGLATVIPVILRPCDWIDLPFGKLLATPKDGKPVTKFPTLDEGFLDIVQSIKAVIKEKYSTRQQPGVPYSPITSSSENELFVITKPRSSNLRIKKTFTELEKDKFLYDAFLYMENFFEGSLQELETRNPAIDYAFRRIDANTFQAVCYLAGSEKSRCTIRLSDKSSGFMTGILYSTGSNYHNGVNESLNVETDGYNLHLKAMGISLYGGDIGNLSFEGAAEYYWSLFLKHLQ